MNLVRVIKIISHFLFMSLKEEIEEWQEEVLSLYCLNECSSSCCANSWMNVVMNSSQVRELYCLDPKEELPQEDLTTIVTCRNEILYRVHVRGEYCRGYDPETKRCKIQHNKPSVCKQAPIFIKPGKVIFSTICELSQKRNSSEFQTLIDICNSYNFPVYVSGKKIL